MADPRGEYTSRDYTAVDAQINQIADRERLVTQKLKIANYRRVCILAGSMLLAFGAFLILAGIAFRIAFPPEPKIVETTKVIEKIIQPPETNIVIKTPPGTIAMQTQDSSNAQQGDGNIELQGSAATDVLAEVERRLESEGVATTGRALRASLSWDNYNDLDLMIKEPDGNIISFKKSSSSSGGNLDIDANARPNSKTSQPVENISWQNKSPRKGTYELYVGFYSRDPSEKASETTPFKVVLQNARTERVFSGQFSNSSPKARKLIHTFTID